MRNKLLLLLALTTAVTTVLTACGGKKDESSKQSAIPKNTEPAEIVFSSLLGKTEEDFNKEIGDPVRKKFPHITPKYIPPGKGSDLKDLVAAGTPPDIYFYVYDRFPTVLQDLGTDFDMSELVKKYSFDLKSFNSTAVDVLKTYTDGKGIYGLPFQINPMALFYNKDIFDKFGVPYPKDGMNWDDTIEMAKKLTRTFEGVQYRGLSTFHGFWLRENQLSLAAVDAGADKPAVNNDGWKRLYTTLEQVYRIPGNMRPATRGTNDEAQLFWKGKNVAMMVNNSDVLRNIPADMNWDLVSLPVFKDKPGIGTQASPNYYSVLSSSKLKDQSFEIITYLLSDEMLTTLSKKGYATPSTKPEIQKTLGADLPNLAGKNINALYFNKFAPPPPKRTAGLLNVSQQANGMAQSHIFDILLDNKDVNTALRQADEEIVKMIEQVKSGSK